MVIIYCKCFKSRYFRQFFHEKCEHKIYENVKSECCSMLTENICRVLIEFTKQNIFLSYQKPTCFILAFIKMNKDKINLKGKFWNRSSIHV